MNRFFKFLYKLNLGRLFLFGVFTPLLINLLIVSVFTALGIEDSNDSDVYKISIRDFVLAVLIVPFLETYFFQYMPLRIAKSYMKKWRDIYCYVIIISSVIFGLLHMWSAFHSFIAFFYGVIWSFCCFIFMRKKMKHPVLLTGSIHACYNCLLFLSAAILDAFCEIT